jgi:hypothetical protein
MRRRCAVCTLDSSASDACKRSEKEQKIISEVQNCAYDACNSQQFSARFVN